jgi:membrane-bound lytic murein transglycosylase D
MQIKRKFSSVLFLLCTLILSACSNLAVNNTNSSNIDLSKNPSDSEHKIINTYADKLISSYNVTFKNDILADNDKSMSLWEHAVYEMNFKPPKHTVNLKAVDYIKKHKKLLTQQLSNGHLFLYHIINELKIRDMPLELAIIPIIESNFNPHAVSYAGAKGMWQFTKGTARRFKLHSDTNYDLRSDPLASTYAALNYFSYLYSMFNDWDLAIAAYNVGEGTVLNAIKRNKAKGLPTDLWNLKIPRSGIDYVEKLYAYTYMLRNAEQNDLKFPNMPYKPVFKKIALKGQNLNEISAKTGVPAERLLKLNPGFKNTKVRTSKTPFVLIPINNYDLPQYYTLNVVSNKNLAKSN